ncbi:MAG: tetratricopeptide repeat protein [Magnetococcales bacterium]|nr:tetratricopeptide repeat protein [Magnetococcales bacterium]
MTDLAHTFFRLMAGLVLALAWHLAGGVNPVWAAGTTEMEKGIAAQKRGQFDEAEAFYTAALVARDLPREAEAEAHANLCLVRLELGQRHKDKKKFAAGFEDCNRAVLLKPDLANAYLFRGNGRLATDQVALASEDFKVAMALMPKDPLPVYFRARAMVRLGKTTEAIKDLDTVLKMRAHFPPALLERGVLYQQKGDMQRALHDFSLAIEHDPNLYDAYFLRAEVQGRLGNTQEALADIDQALLLRPDNPLAIFRRGLFSIALGEVETGIAAFEQARRLSPEDPQIPVGLGFARFIQGRYAMAGEAFAQALALAPDDPFIRLWLALARLKHRGATASSNDDEGIGTGDLEQWPNPLLAMVLGTLAPEAVVRRAEKREKTGREMAMAEAFFFIGQYHLLRGNVGEAKKWLRKNIELDTKDPLLTAITNRELNRLSVMVSSISGDTESGIPVLPEKPLPSEVASSPGGTSSAPLQPFWPKPKPLSINQQATSKVTHVAE